MDVPLECFMECHMTISETHSFASVLWTSEIYLGPYHGMVNPCVYFTFSYQINFFPFFFPPSTSASSWNNMFIVAFGTCLCILFSQHHWYIYCVYKRLDIFVSTNVFYLFFHCVQSLYIIDIPVLILMLGEWGLD